MNAPQKVVTPLAQNQTNQCTITPPWFVNKSEYHPLASSFQPLVNGEEAFGAVYRAILAAQKSVCIVCWGFQPSMYFLRGPAGGSKCIGQLLEDKGKEGVKIKVLSYVVDPLWLGIDLTGAISGESNTPGRRWAAAGDRPPRSSNEQYRYDQEWYLRYDEDQKVADGLGKEKWGGLDGTPRTHNLHFVGRGFSPAERASVARQEHADRGLSATTKATLAGAPSHHQKMVLVDYEDSQRCVGFVMGHNMLDEYWDTDRHSYLRHGADQGRNGNRPRHDLSSRVTGPTVGDLFLNFAQAWKKETGESLNKPDFSNYPMRVDGGGMTTFCQVLRTQSQYAVQDIKRAYLQAVNNASNYIYIENQYFRWPPLAEKIKAAARAQTCAGREPGKHGPLYLFVVTNADDEAVNSGSVNTYRMLDSLGRADTIPAVARQKELDVRKSDLALAQKRQEAADAAVNRSAERYQAASNSLNPSFGDDHLQLVAEANAARDEAEKARKALATSQSEIARAKQNSKDKERTILPQEQPGLKIHLCTLVAPDTPAKHAWSDVYVHAKVMLIDDAFMTLGSANINTRSMEVDSELNIAHHRPEITLPLRQRLWGMHTKSQGAQIDPAEAFDAWGWLLTVNKEARSKGEKPRASLIEFYRGSPKIGDKD